MKKLILASLVFLSVNSALAGEPKATMCSGEAIEAATALFKVNNKGSNATVSKVDLIDMSHEEGGFEMWDISMKSGKTMFTPYRIHVYVDGCTVYKFEMPFAG